jgi:hypothetical protein
MGQELECRVRRGGKIDAGKAYLETGFLLFRGAGRLKIPFTGMERVRAEAGVLKLEWEGAPLEFELGKGAEKWAGKILHPPTRLEKLGVKAGLTYRLAGKFDAGFESELRGAGASAAKGREKADLILVAAEREADLDGAFGLVAGMQPAGGLWVVYPKGVPAIREIQVLEAGRAAGLKDVKVASFSATHTALKFVIPLTKR